MNLILIGYFTLVLPLLGAATNSSQTTNQIHQQAEALIENKQYSQAVIELEKIRSQGKKDRQTLLLLGKAYLAQKLFQLALNVYSEVYKTNERDIEANRGRAKALIGLGDAQKALKHARLITELQPDDVDGWELLGNAYIHPQTQDYPRAAETFRRVLELDPKHLKAGLNLAYALSYKKEVKQAIDVLESVFKYHPEDLELMVKLAESYYVIRDLEKAEQLVIRALKKDPANQAALDVREQISFRKAYNLWIPIVAIISFPVLFFLVRWMRRGKTPKIERS
jgi:tetratricopeptide (TPR) repeat protein